MTHINSSINETQTKETTDVVKVKKCHMNGFYYFLFKKKLQVNRH